MKMKLKNNDMKEYFELYKILEDGEVEHIDQICINDKNIFQTIYDNFKELQDYVNNDYFVSVYDIELKKYLINTNIENPSTGDIRYSRVIGSPKNSDKGGQ